MIKFIRQIRNLKTYVRDSELLKIWKTDFFPPGHYYTPLNDINYLKENENKLFKYDTNIKDINLRIYEQKELLNELLQYYKTQPFSKGKSNSKRYYFENNFFSFSDGIFLFCMMNYVKPTKIIEIGSGFSSALILDVNEDYFENTIELTFIEPFPEERLLTLISGSDKANIIKSIVQDVDLSIFSSLKSGDMLFIDSSHVSKFGSDVNHLLFNILPLLNSGVYIHFHDVIFPFEYPKEWILSGRSWSESYLLRAFLMNNNDYEISLFSSMMEYYAFDWLKENMPLTLEVHEKWPSENEFKYYLPHKGQSLWIRKK